MGFQCSVTVVCDDCGKDFPENPLQVQNTFFAWLKIEESGWRESIKGFNSIVLCPECVLSREITKSQTHW